MQLLHYNVHFDCVNGFLNSIKEIIWQTVATYRCPLKFTTNYQEKMDRSYDSLKGQKITPAPHPWTGGECKGAAPHAGVGGSNIFHYHWLSLFLSFLLFLLFFPSFLLFLFFSFSFFFRVRACGMLQDPKAPPLDTPMIKVHKINFKNTKHYQ